MLTSTVRISNPHLPWSDGHLSIASITLKPGNTAVAVGFVMVHCLWLAAGFEKCYFGFGWRRAFECYFGGWR